MAVSVDLESYDKRRAAMLKLLQVAARQAPLAEWMKFYDWIGVRKTEKLDYYLDVLYILIEDIVLLQQNAGPLRNPDARQELEIIAQKVIV